MSDLTHGRQRSSRRSSRRCADRPAGQATYRLQFRRERMTFRQAGRSSPTCDELGVSHLYASPCLKTRSGSPHGYAVVDYGQLNPELGTRRGLRGAGRRARTTTAWARSWTSCPTT